MQKFIITLADENYTAKQIEDAIYNTFTEMGHEDIIVTESV